ncbi:hypothetical protein EDC96DRAFT_507996 [Choanephora cucurbitarum]|nr:hypothetical protein EDC96DRAFT_507996 [Choanephora cucurbitarum]
MNPDLTNERLQQQEMNQKIFEAEDPNDSAGGEDSDNDKPARRSGRRKIKIEYIEDKNRRHITFSKRKAGIMKKAYELSTLTGTQVLLLVVSETGLVYTFTTVKLQPIVTKPEGKNLIQACLNAPDPMSTEQASGDASYNNTSPQIDEKKAIYDDTKPDPSSVAGGNGAGAVPPQQPPSQPPSSQQPPAPTGYNNNGGNGSSNPGYQPQQPYGQHQPSHPPPPPPTGPNSSPYSGHSGYMNGQNGYQPPPPSQPQGAYGQMPQPSFYGGQQQHYMPHQQPQGYWQQQQPGNALPRQDQPPMMDDKTRRGIKK